LKRSLAIVALVALLTDAPACGGPPPEGAHAGGPRASGAHPNRRRPPGKPDQPGRRGPRLNGPLGSSARAAPGGDATAPRPRLGIAQRLMKSGNANGAVALYRRQVATHPDAPAAHVGLGRALARTGACAEALEHLAPHEDTVPFGVQAALAAAGCAGRLGLHAEALRYDVMAYEQEPENPRVLTNLLLDADTVGDTVWVARALDALDTLETDGDAPWYARAVLALRAGDLDGFDVTLALWERARAGGAQQRQLRARSWLDAGDAVMASVALREVPLFRAGAFARTLHAETARRLGQVPEARAILQVDDDEPFDAAEGDALRARVLVDAGDFDSAEALLARADAGDGEVAASAWYLARAQGDAVAMARAEALWRVARRSPLRRLEHLVPSDAP
jgi:predicted Zn-dependent protease